MPQRVRTCTAADAVRVLASCMRCGVVQRAVSSAAARWLGPHRAHRVQRVERNLAFVLTQTSLHAHAE